MDRYAEWKQMYGVEEEGMKPWFYNYERNFALVQAHNQRYKQGLETYELYLNYPWAHLTQEEFSKKMGGLVLNDEEYKQLDELLPTGMRVPNALDLRSTNCVNPVKKQSCGICWAYSVSHVLETNKCLANKKRPTPSISPQMYADCIKGRSASCDGGVPVEAINFTQQTGKCISEVDYPVTGNNQTCRQVSKPKLPIQVKVVKILTPKSEAAFKEALVKLGAISVVTCSANMSFYSPTNGDRQPFDPQIKGNRCNELDHAVTVVGWNDKKAWIVLNSWGNTWGNKGYFTVPFNKAQWLRFYDYPVTAQVA